MSAIAPSLFRVTGLDGLAHAALWLVAATSGLVMTEPSPHDALVLALMIGSLVVGLRIPHGVAPLAILMTAFLAGDAIGSTRARDIDGAMAHTLITFYLGTTAPFFACICAWRPESTVRVILSGMLVAALLAAVTGIAGYFSIGSMSADLFTLYDRAKGTFKDPNVFGPFLVLPLLFTVAGLLTGRMSSAFWRLPVIGILLGGILLSFSRGAWLHLVLSSAVFFVLAVGCVRDGRVGVRAVAIAFIGAIAVSGAVVWALSFEDIGRSFAERASLNQSYDLSATGRFAGQIKALALVVAEPLGIGSTEFLRYHPEDAHNVYLTAFLNGGWLGGFAYIALVMTTLWRGLDAALRPGPAQMLAITVFSAFVGVVVEGLVIDTDHWRHFFTMMGLIWGMSAACNRRDPRGAGRSSPD